MATTPYCDSHQETQWKRRMERTIAQGHEEEFAKAMDFAAQDSSIRDRAVSWVVGAIIHAKHNHPGPRKRETLLRMFLDHPRCALPEPALAASYIPSCLEHNQLGLIPLLHQAGCPFRGTDADVAHLAKLIGKGKWPHAELLCPRLLHHPAARLPVSLFRELALKPRLLEKLLLLDAPPPKFKRALSRALPRSEDNLLPLHQTRPDLLPQCVAKLLGAAWIDPAEVAREAEEISQTRFVCQIMAQAQALMLHTQLPTSTRQGARRRL